MKLYTKDKEIIDSGLVITFKNEPIIFELRDDMKITVFLTEDDSIDDQRIDIDPISRENMELKLVNFNNSLGTGNSNPLQLGSIDNKHLYLNIVVYSLGKDTQKTLQYTWFLDKEVNNG